MRLRDVVRARTLLAVLGAVAVSCSKAEAPTEPNKAAVRSVESGWEQLPSRAEVVARADEWAVKGAKLQGPSGAQWLTRAAGLRERVWRLEGRDPDALEALELYGSAAERSWGGACGARLQRILLNGEFSGNPERAFRELYRLRSHSKEPSCRRRISRALGMLEAYRPLPSVLAQLDRDAGSGAAPEGSAADRQDHGQVIVPKRAAPTKPARITHIERYGARDSARVVVFLTEPVEFRAGVLDPEAGRGPRLYVDIERTSYRGSKNFEVGGLVKQIRLGKQAAATRLVLDLASPVFHRIFYLPEPFRLIIDVSKTAPPEKPAAKVGNGKRMVKRVVLDPGHGGHDPGAVGPSGLREKDVTLDIAHRAAPLLARELSISTLLTRDTDSTVSLPERTARANAFQADLFISIHCNASEHPNSTGIMTFILDESKDALASQIAARENAASQAAGAELANAMSRVLGAGSLQESLRFAELLQRAALASVGEHYPDVKDHGVRRAGFYVLAGARMPSVLYEASFISNPRGEVRLNTGDFRQKMADSIVNAIRAYRDGF